MEKIAVVGAGSWGTTLAVLLGEKGYKVNLWVREKELAEKIKTNRENPQYLPNIKIPDSVKPFTSIKDAVLDTNMVVMAVPSQYMRAIAKEISGYVKSDSIIINVAKGIEQKTYKTMSMVLADEIKATKKIVSLSGPNHAEEVSRKMPTATVIASHNYKCLGVVKEVFQTKYFKVFIHDDIVGIEVCGAIKNIAAIATGVCHGLGYGDNAKGSIITLGLYEMSKFGKFFNAKRGTFYGLAGVGDLVATCTSKHSRNRLVGIKIAEGKSLKQIKDEMHGMIAEGINTSKVVHDYIEKRNINMPLTKQVYSVLYKNKNLSEAIEDLLGHY